MNHQRTPKMRTFLALAMFFLVHSSTIALASKYPKDVNYSWLNHSLDELFQDANTAYQKEGALSEFTERYNWYIKKLNERHESEAMDRFDFMHQFYYARKLLLQGLFKAGETDFSVLFTNFRPLIIDSGLEIEMLRDWALSLDYKDVSPDERRDRQIELLQEAVDHPEFMAYDNKLTLGMHLQILEQLARLKMETAPDESYAHFMRFFQEGLEREAFVVSSFYRRWDEFTTWSRMQNLPIQNESVLGAELQRFHQNFRGQKYKDPEVQAEIDQRYKDRTTLVFKRNAFDQMYEPPVEGGGPCFAHDQIGQTIRKGTIAPPMRAFVTDCLDLDGLESTHYTLSVDYGNVGFQWFTVAKQTQRDHLKQYDHSIISIAFQNTDQLEIGSYSGSITITTASGSNQIPLHLNVWY